MTELNTISESDIRLLEEAQDHVWQAAVARHGDKIITKTAGDLYVYISDIIRTLFEQGELGYSETQSSGHQTVRDRVLISLPKVLKCIMILDLNVGNDTAQILSKLPLHLEPPSFNLLLSKLVHYSGNIFSVAYSHDESLVEGLLSHDTIQLSYFLNLIRINCDIPITSIAARI